MFLTIVQCTWLYSFYVRRGARMNRGYDQGYDIAKKIEFVTWPALGIDSIFLNGNRIELQATNKSEIRM